MLYQNTGNGALRDQRDMQERIQQRIAQAMYQLGFKQKVAVKEVA